MVKVHKNLILNVNMSFLKIKVALILKNDLITLKININLPLTYL